MGGYLKYHVTMGSNIIVKGGQRDVVVKGRLDIAPTSMFVGGGR
jgi:hypothetical protein